MHNFVGVLLLTLQECLYALTEHGKGNLPSVQRVHHLKESIHLLQV